MCVCYLLELPLGCVFYVHILFMENFLHKADEGVKLRPHTFSKIAVMLCYIWTKAELNASANEPG